MAKKFILNDETVQNSYGFYILTAGIKLDRFKQNPVMLSDHKNENDFVIGKWDNHEVTKTQLLAIPDFYPDSEKAKDIAGKVNGGYLKGASMGIIFDPSKLVIQGGKTVLLECELFEASIVPVPSNKNSVCLYNSEGEQLKEEEIKSLCLSVVTKTKKHLKTPQEGDYQGLLDEIAKYTKTASRSDAIIDAVRALAVIKVVYQDAIIDLLNVDNIEELEEQFNDVQIARQFAKMLTDTFGKNSTSTVNNSLLKVLNLDVTANNKVVISAIQNLNAKVSMFEKAQEQEAERITDFLISRTHLSPAFRSHQLELFKKDFEGEKERIRKEFFFEPISLSAKVRNPNPSEITSYNLDEMRRLHPNTLLEDPELYARLRAEKFGKS